MIKLARAVGVAALIAVVTTVGFFALPERVVSPKRPSYALPEVLSEATKTELKRYADRWKNIAIITVLSLDFNHNERVALYNVVPNKHVDDRMTAYKRERSTDKEYGRISPIFSTNKVHNTDILRVVTGKFACVDGSTSLFAELYDLQDTIISTCRMPIDPSVGRVVGYLAIHFVAPPLSPSQIKQIEIDTKVLVTTIYFNEIVPR